MLESRCDWSRVTARYFRIFVISCHYASQERKYHDASYALFIGVYDSEIRSIPDEDMNDSITLLPPHWIVLPCYEPRFMIRISFHALFWFWYRGLATLHDYEILAYFIVHFSMSHDYRDSFWPQCYIHEVIMMLLAFSFVVETHASAMNSAEQDSLLLKVDGEHYGRFISAISPSRCRFHFHTHQYAELHYITERRVERLFDFNIYIGF